MFSENVQHYKHTVAILPIFETGPFLGVRDPTPLAVKELTLSPGQHIRCKI